MGFLDKDGLSALWGKITAKLDGKRDKVIAVRKYENIIATANTQAAGTFYMIAVKPDSFYEPCTVRFKVHAEINPAMTNANRLYYNEDTTSEMIFTGTGCNYRNTNALYSTSYRPYYYISAYRLNKAGFDAGKPIYIGVSLYNATAATTTTLKRDITVELLEVIGGTAELLEEPVLQSAFYSATNYNEISNTDATSAGTKQTGDNNSIDRLYYGSYSPLAGASLYGTQVVLSSDGITFYSICTSRSTATNKTCTSQGFLPEHLMYYSGSGTVAKDKRLATYSLYDALPFDFRYSANCGSTLTAHKPVYLVCTFNKSEKLYYLDTTKWYTQDVPTSEDGKYYILLGYSYGAYSIYIKPTHPVYVYKDGVFTTVERVSAGNSGGSSEPEVFTIGGVLQGANNGITFGTVQQTDEEIKEAFENDKRCVFYLEYEDGVISLPITDYKKDQIITLMAESYFGLICEKWFSGSMVDVDIDTMQNSALGKLYIGSGFFAIIKQTFNIVAFNGAYSALEGTPDIPTRTSDLTNDSGFLTEHQDISGKADKGELPNLTPYATKDYVAAYVAANGGGSVDSYTNLFDVSTAQLNTQWSAGSTKASNGIVATAKIPISISTDTSKPTIIRIHGYTPWSWKDSAENIQYFDASGDYKWYAPIKNGTSGKNFGTDENGDFYVYAGWASDSAVSPNAGTYKYIALSFQIGNYSAITENDVKNIVITIDEPITGSGSSGSVSISTSPLADKKVLVLGDSISTDAYGNYKKWVTDLIEEEFFPSDITNNSYHATGFLATYSESGNVVSDTFLNRLKAVSNKSDYDLIIVFGGINDYIQAKPLADFKTAVDAFFEYLTTEFLNARILVLSPLRTYNIYKNTAGYYQTEYAEYIRTAAKSWCLPVLNLTEESGFYPFKDSFKAKWTLVPSGYTSADGVHPNAEYSRDYLAPMIRNFIKQYV